MENKKGFEMTISTIILMILGIALLVALLIMFVYQAGIFNKSVKSQNTETTVDSFISNCNGLLDGDLAYSYCCDKREVKFMSNEVLDKKELSCKEAQGYNWSSGRLDGFDCSNIVC